MHDQWLTQEQACLIVERSPATLRRWVALGYLQRRYWLAMDGRRYPLFDRHTLLLSRNHFYLSKRSCPGPGRGKTSE